MVDISMILVLFSFRICGAHDAHPVFVKMQCTHALPLGAAINAPSTLTSIPGTRILVPNLRNLSIDGDAEPASMSYLPRPPEQ